MKICATCHQTLDDSEFWNRGGTRIGLQASCKTCDRKREHRRRTDNPAQYLEKGTRFYHNHREDILERRRQAYAAHPEKAKARQQVVVALRKGLLFKQTCAICGKIKVEAHHADYTKPLEVQWLCRHDHHLIHK